MPSPPERSRCILVAPQAHANTFPVLCPLCYRTKVPHTRWFSSRHRYEMSSTGTSHVAGTKGVPGQSGHWLGLFYAGGAGMGLTTKSWGDFQMKIRTAIAAAITVLIVSGLWAEGSKSSTTVEGYVLDSACAFTKDLKKPISRQCATACAKAGSPLVILADDGTVYWPIAKTTPSTGQNSRLLPFAGERVSARGEVFERGGSRALAIETIEAVKSAPAA